MIGKRLDSGFAKEGANVDLHAIMIGNSSNDTRGLYAVSAEIEKVIQYADILPLEYSLPATDKPAVGLVAGDSPFFASLPGQMTRQRRLVQLPIGVHREERYIDQVDRDHIGRKHFLQLPTKLRRRNALFGGRHSCAVLPAGDIVSNHLTVPGSILNSYHHDIFYLSHAP